MKKIITLFCILFFADSYSQEICNNGIDDDNDGLIDLNDNDCTCNSSLWTPSLIPNHSFEEYSACPYQISQMNNVIPWTTLTNATTDYFNTCNYAPYLKPFPDGNGAVGFIIQSFPTSPDHSGYEEYFASCLPTGLLSGHTYKLKMQLASFTMNSSGFPEGDGTPYYGPVDITIFGASDCNEMFLPFHLSCPSNFTSAWEAIGSASYTPVNRWGNFEIIFTLDHDINAIAIGGPCVVPDDMVQTQIGSIEEGHLYSIIPYFMADDLVLNELSLFGDLEIENTENCNGSILSLRTPLSAGASYQWYRNGMAIPNATESTYKTINPVATDEFLLVATIDGHCLKSNALHSSYTQCQIQRGISVDGDGFNDFFDLSRYNVKKLTIYNRYGIKVYAKENYINEWAGQTTDGKQLPDGIYYNFIEFADGARETSWIYLNRKN